jgi:uncharacterized membrane protein YbjE (DUF340 family)
MFSCQKPLAWTYCLLSVLIFDLDDHYSHVSDRGRDLRKKTMFFDIVLLLGFVAVGAVFALIVEFLNAV